MAKKMFESLDLIFEENHMDTFKDTSPLLGVQKKSIRRIAKTAQQKRKSIGVSVKSSKRTVRKSFAASMNILFEIPKSAPNKEKLSDAKLAGIDYLIRGTLEQSKIKVVQVAPKQKRVTFVIDKQKLQKIKNLAKSEKVYIKDVFDRVVTEFLEKKGL